MMVSQIQINSDGTMYCPTNGCTVSISLTHQGAEMMIARQTKCRVHDVPLVWSQPKPEDS